jgi:hypothetical protein
LISAFGLNTFGAAFGSLCRFAALELRSSSHGIVFGIRFADLLAEGVGFET